MTEDYGFIHDFAEMILEHCPTNRAWAEANATALLSTAVGPKKYIMSPFKQLKLNSMDMMIGPSGLAMKSVVLWGFTYPVLGKLSNLIGIDVIMPNRYSIEGMIEWFAKHSSHGAYIRDEFTSVFKETSKSYLGDTLEFISEMYDGTMQKRFTRKSKLEQTKNVYVPFLSATTPYLYKLMKPSFFIQGTGNRPRYIIYDVEEEDRDFEWDFSKIMELRKNKKLDEYAELLACYYKSSTRGLYPIPEAQDVWQGFWTRIKQECKKRYRKNPFDLVYTYIIRSPERVWRQLGNRSKIEDVLVKALIRNGEVCGTSILAGHLIKTELASRIERKNYTNSLEDLLDITCNVLRRARRLSQTKGKTIFIITGKSRLK